MLPRGGHFVFRFICLIRRPIAPSASCASQTDPIRLLPVELNALPPRSATEKLRCLGRPSKNRTTNGVMDAVDKFAPIPFHCRRAQRQQVGERVNSDQGDHGEGVLTVSGPT